MIAEMTYDEYNSRWESVGSAESIISEFESGNHVELDLDGHRLSVKSAQHDGGNDVYAYAEGKQFKAYNGKLVENVLF